MNSSAVVSPTGRPVSSILRRGLPTLALGLALALAGCKKDTPSEPTPTETASGGAQDALVGDPVAWVRTYIEKDLGGDLGIIHVNTAKVDLDGDGIDEVLAYASGSMMCGTGGCDLLVLKPEGADFKLMGDLSVVQLPVGVLDSKTNGWRDLAVSVSGGGMPSGIRRVPFDGAHYASNPTSADVGEADSLGTVLITYDDLNPPEDEPAKAK